MAESSLRINYMIILDIIVLLQNDYPEDSFIPKDLLLQKLLTIPDVRRKRLNLNWKMEGFKGVLHRLQELNLIESRVIIKKGLRKMIKISSKGIQLLDDLEFVREFIKIPSS